MKKKILVIDDDKHVRTYLASLFEDHGYEVRTAANSRDGLEKARQQAPDLITLDIEMPGEWGPRFYQHLSREESLNKIPVIVISGLAGHEEAVKKAAATISKPFDPSHLMNTVQRILT